MWNVSRVAPKSPGHRVRELFVEARDAGALWIHQTPPGRRAPQLSTLILSASSRRRIETTFQGKTGNRSLRRAGVLCVGVARWASRFETPVGPAYHRRSPTSSASTSLNADRHLISLAALNYMRYSGATRRNGDTPAAALVPMRPSANETVLAEIQNGTTRRRGLPRDEAGRSQLQKAARGRSQPPDRTVVRGVCAR